jgi:PilZ domain
MSNTDNAEINKRTAQRFRVLKQGKILLPHQLSALDCTVKDISDTGAKLICAVESITCEEFRLVITADRMMRDVKIAWRRPDMVGVKFTSEPRKAPLLKW